MTIEGNVKAVSNGFEMENIIKSLYPGAVYVWKGVLDFIIDGKNVELKSCQEYVTDSSKSTQKRKGRFCFNDLQHMQAIENNADYILLVQNEGTPLIYVRTPAKKIKLGKFHGVKSVCWSTAIKGVLA